jgi:hypothetical protein
VKKLLVSRKERGEVEEEHLVNLKVLSVMWGVEKK